MNLRQITIKDQIDLKKVYFDSIKSIDEKIYSNEQKRAWSSQAWENSSFKKSIIKGNGWLIEEKEKVIAFALRFPKNKISLLYCIAEYQRKGCGSKLICKIQEEAKDEGLNSLKTEASLISYKLFIRHNWKIIRKEKITIKNILFKRYKMIKNF